MRVRDYAIRLLGDQKGQWEFIIPIVLTMFSTARGAYQQQVGIKAGKHALERQMAYETQTREALEKADLAKLKEMTDQQREITKQVQASGFQTGRYSGPLFQVMRR